MTSRIQEYPGPSIWFHTFGCKANQYDTERIRQELQSRGARTVSAAAGADVAVINTCTVTNQADADARRLIRRLRREKPGLTILVAGCSAAVREDDYREMSEVDDVVGGQDPAHVAEALGRLVPFQAPGSDSGGLLRRNVRGTRGWLKIQDGCDRKCSFCATRIARGVSRSRPVEEIVAEARLLAGRHPELVLTGIHIGHYGRDLEPAPTLARLCATLLDSVDVRFRLGSIEATEIDDEMLELLHGSDGRLAPHLHVPMQSGSDEILRAMRRWHTRDAYRRRMEQIAERLPILGLGADVIVGFPGENEVEFGQTREMVEALPFTYLHVFPYSVRDSTVAASLPDKVPGDVAARRSRDLRELVQAKGERYRVSRAGTVADVVVEGDPTRVVGLTGDYLRVEVNGEAARPGDRFRAVLELDGERLVVSPPPGNRSLRAS